MSFIKGIEDQSLLITGGAGFIGRNLLKVLSEHGWSGPIVSVDLNHGSDGLEPDYALDALDATCIAADICDYDAMSAVIDEHNPSFVLHLAAETHVDKSIEDPLLFAKSNYLGTATLLEAVRKKWSVEDYSCKRFVYVSTDEVYGTHGDVVDEAFDEDSRLLPSSPYSASKAAGDLVAGAYWKTYGFPVVVTRSSNNYGPGQFCDKLIPKFIKRALCHEPLPLYGDGLNARDWLYVDDHCEAILAAAVYGRTGEIYNVCADEHRANLDVAKEILRLCRDEMGDSTISEDQIEFVTDRLGHDLRYDMSSQKIRSLTGWQPKTKFEQGLKMTVQWYLAHPEWCQ